MTTQIFKTYLEFSKRDNKSINGVSPKFAENHPNWEDENKTNKGCWNCSGCSGCSDCSGCSGCYHRSDCYDCYGRASSAEAPIIPRIHSAVLEAASQPDALNMGIWHTCETTHCRAGWVVTLAGEEGKKLERQTSAQFAAMQIYKASSDIRVPPTRFFESDEEAMKDMRRCAELEAGTHGE
jgi:hypothetical protein